MIVPGTEGVAPRFDFDAAKRLYESTAKDSELTGEMITSPFDLYAVETLRDRHGLRVGEAVPTDVFVFVFGEPDDPRCTKIGGRPFWPKGRPWPTEDGGPHREPADRRLRRL